MTDRVIIQSETPPEDPKHVEEMLRVAEGLEKPVSTEERPGWLPEKFKSVEDMAKAYQELEKKLGAPKDVPAAEAPKTPENPLDAKNPLEIKPEDAKTTVENAGLDFDALEAEYMAEGTLSEASYERLEKAGIPRPIVDSYVAGIQAQARTLELEAYSAVGGEAQYQAMASWAASNLTQAEKDAFNAATAGTKEQLMFAVQGLHAKYTAANGREPALLNAPNGVASGPIFRSVEEMTSAMSDPRYHNDPAYRNDVQERLMRSNIL